VSTPKHSPLPWRTDEKFPCNIEDAEGTLLTSCWGEVAPSTLDKANAEFIVKAANKHDTLRALVRRFIGIVNNYPPIMSAWALLDAEEPAWRKLPAEKQAAMVPEGYKRLSALMRDAYAAVGPEEPE
jgi:hypothetical protein